MPPIASRAPERPIRMCVAADARCPHVVFEQVLGAGRVAALLDHVAARRDDFCPSSISRRATFIVDQELRRSLSLRDLGPFESEIDAVVRSIAGAALAALHIAETAVEPRQFDLVAFRDGDYLRAHIDTTERADKVRVLSGVYYFATTPRRFTGGELRLHGFPRPSAGSRPELAPHVDVAPDTDTLVVFPSMLRHEVLPVHVPSGAWLDSRFTLNCWLHRVQPSAADAPARP
jgi:Rps23 Pro-64 3,4-dihydroxylase Tpa1-like proline 4-hydroxylase